MPDRLTEAQQSLVNYVYEALGMGPLFPSGFDLLPYVNLLPSGGSRVLVNILTALDGQETDDEQTPRLLMLPSDYVRGKSGQSPAEFLARQGQSINEIRGFEAWIHLIRQAATTVRGVQGEPGVSLYHEFKLLSAIVHASRGNTNRLEDGFTLISGDFPGVQRTIYTISSDGATKGVRGRSFFLQLLADCTVRRLLAECGGMPMTNALVVAGGNFLLLVPTGYEEQVAQISREINNNLLNLFYGDISMTTAAVAVDTSIISSSIRLTEAAERLRTQSVREKTRPFASVALSGSDEAWQHVFREYGAGTEVTCIVCQREPRDEQDWREIEAITNKNATPDAEEEDWVCRECKAFSRLAEHLAKNPSGSLIFEPAWNSAYAHEFTYSQKLYEISGWSCRLEQSDSTFQPHAGNVILQLGNMDFDPAHEDGFRLFAVHTPVVSAQDEIAWGSAIPGTNEGSICSFGLLATRRTPGFARLGYLRMDVDSLGSLFKERLTPVTLTRQMAASDALSLFFDGYLAELCRAFERDERRENGLYLLYGGGDDLFIVGEWDVIPRLAEHIQNQFREYTQAQLTISAAVSLYPAGFPFYRAADLVGEALESAKARYAPDKNAIAFLGGELQWNDWVIVNTWHQLLLDVAKALNSDTVTRNVLDIYHRWETDRLTLGRDKIYFGPYMWLAAYQMTRIWDSQRKKGEEIERAIDDLQERLLRPETIWLSGVAARWAELERRARHESIGE